MMKWIVRIWCALNALALAHALIYPSAPSSGAELGMLMFFLNFPSSLPVLGFMNRRSKSNCLYIERAVLLLFCPSGRIGEGLHRKICR